MVPSLEGSSVEQPAVSLDVPALGLEVEGEGDAAGWAEPELELAELPVALVSCDGGAPLLNEVVGLRSALYALSVALRLHDPDAALRSAASADELWQAGEPRAFGVWSLIQAGAGIAHIMKGDLTAASERLAQVTQLPPDLRISTITGYLEDMDVLLGGHRFAGTQQAADMREQIAAFITSSAPGAQG